MSQFTPQILPDTSIWFYDSYSKDAGLNIHIKKIVAQATTKYQQVKIIDTFEFGQILVLNQYMYQAEQGTELTEMLVHVPFNCNGSKLKILLIGGGDGVSLSELVKYPFIQNIDVVEIDQDLNQLCRQHFFVNPKVWLDPRVKVHYADGFDFLQKYTDKYDIILSAASEIFNNDGSPNMAYSLFTSDFYNLALSHLTDQGIFVTDASTWHYTSENYHWAKLGHDLQQIFPKVFPYHFNSKRMPGGEFVLLFASTKIDPIKDFIWRGIDLNTKYYNPDIHTASFVLPETFRQVWIQHSQH